MSQCKSVEIDLADTGQNEPVTEWEQLSSSCIVNQFQLSSCYIVTQFLGLNLNANLPIEIDSTFLDKESSCRPIVDLVWMSFSGNPTVTHKLCGMAWHGMYGWYKKVIVHVLCIILPEADTANPKPRLVSIGN